MMRCPLDWEIYRRAAPDGSGDLGDRSNGYLVIPARQMVVVFSNGGDWEHVSVSFRDRCPTWEEMEEVKRRFWEPADTVMQLHVPVSEHRNCHPYCLHLWRPLGAEIPRPPGIYVAPPEGGARMSHQHAEPGTGMLAMIVRLRHIAKDMREEGWYTWAAMVSQLADELTERERRYIKADAALSDALNSVDGSYRP